MWTERYPDRSVVELLTVADYDRSIFAHLILYSHQSILFTKVLKTTSSFAALDKKKGLQSKPGSRGEHYDALKQRLVDQVRSIL